MVVLPGHRTVEPLPAVATGMVQPPNQMAAAMARKNLKMGRRRGRQVCVYERGHRQDRLEPLAPCGPPRTDCNPLLKGTHTSHGPMASLL